MEKKEEEDTEAVELGESGGVGNLIGEAARELEREEDAEERGEGFGFRFALGARGAGGAP